MVGYETSKLKVLASASNNLAVGMIDIGHRKPLTHLTREKYAKQAASMQISPISVKLNCTPPNLLAAKVCWRGAMYGIGCIGC